MGDLKSKYFYKIADCDSATTKKYKNTNQIGKQIEKDLKCKKTLQSKTGLTDSELRDLLKNKWSESVYEKYKDKLSKLDESFNSTKNIITEKKRVLSKLQKAYREFFFDMLDVYGVDSPASLDEKDKKDFFNDIKKKWKYQKRKINKGLNESIISENITKEQINSVIKTLTNNDKNILCKNVIERPFDTSNSMFLLNLCSNEILKDFDGFMKKMKHNEYNNIVNSFQNINEGIDLTVSQKVSIAKNTIKFMKHLKSLIKETVKKNTIKEAYLPSKVFNKLTTISKLSPNEIKKELKQMKLDGLIFDYKEFNDGINVYDKTGDVKFVFEFGNDEWEKGDELLDAKSEHKCIFKNYTSKKDFRTIDDFTFPISNYVRIRK